MIKDRGYRENMVMVTATSGGAQKLLLISGKQSGGGGGSTASFGRPISVVLPPSPSQASSDSESSSSAGQPVRKRQRLTHLSPEEKALRRFALNLRTVVFLFFWFDNLNMRSLLKTLWSERRNTVSIKSHKMAATFNSSVINLSILFLAF